MISLEAEVLIHPVCNLSCQSISAISYIPDVQIEHSIAHDEYQSTHPPRLQVERLEMKVDFRVVRVASQLEVFPITPRLQIEPVSDI